MRDFRKRVTLSTGPGYLEKQKFKYTKCQKHADVEL